MTKQEKLVHVMAAFFVLQAAHGMGAKMHNSMFECTKFIVVSEGVHRKRSLKRGQKPFCCGTVINGPMKSPASRLVLVCSLSAHGSKNNNAFLPPETYVLNFPFPQTSSFPVQIDIDQVHFSKEELFFYFVCTKTVKIYRYKESL